MNLPGCDSPRTSEIPIRTLRVFPSMSAPPGTGGCVPFTIERDTSGLRLSGGEMSFLFRAFGSAKSGGPLASVRALIDRGILAIASQPKNNQLNLDNRRLKRLYVFLIDHDYPGGSA